MKLQHLVPISILALTMMHTGAFAGHFQKGVVQKSSSCGCGAVQKRVHTVYRPACGCGSIQKSSCGCGSVQKASCGCGSVQKGHGIVQKGHGVIQKGHGIVQKGHGVYQKHGIVQKSHGIAQKSHGVVQKTHAVVQKGHAVAQKGHHVAQKGHGIFQKPAYHSKSHCSKGGCSTCCIPVIPAVLDGVHHLTSSVGHAAARLFACDTCGKGGKSKAGCVSKGCGCGGSSSKVGLPVVPPNPFVEDELQAPPVPATDAARRTERRPTHRQVIHQPVTRRPVPRRHVTQRPSQPTPAAPVVQLEPRPLVVTVAAPLQSAARVERSRTQAPAPVRTVSADRRESRVPSNPLRAN